MASYTSGGQLEEWREVEGGKLPQPRPKVGLRATLVGDILFVTGGNGGFGNYGFGERLTSILSWDPATESWQLAGDLAVAKHSHAAVAVPSSIIDC